MLGTLGFKRSNPSNFPRRDRRETRSPILRLPIYKATPCYPLSASHHNSVPVMTKGRRSAAGTQTRSRKAANAAAQRRRAEAQAAKRRARTGEPSTGNGGSSSSAQSSSQSRNVQRRTDSSSSGAAAMVHGELADALDNDFFVEANEATIEEHLPAVMTLPTTKYAQRPHVNGPLDRRPGKSPVKGWAQRRKPKPGAFLSVEARKIGAIESQAALMPELSDLGVVAQPVVCWNQGEDLDLYPRVSSLRRAAVKKTADLDSHSTTSRVTPSVYRTEIYDADPHANINNDLSLLGDVLDNLSPSAASTRLTRLAKASIETLDVFTKTTSSPSLDLHNTASTSNPTDLPSTTPSSTDPPSPHPSSTNPPSPSTPSRAHNAQKLTTKPRKLSKGKDPDVFPVLPEPEAGEWCRISPADYGPGYRRSVFAKLPEEDGGGEELVLEVLYMPPHLYRAVTK